MIYFLILLMIALLIYIISKVTNAKKKILSTPYDDTTLTHTTQSYFIPYKIVENDNTLRTIVDDYDEREKESIKDFETRLGKALPNDVIWSILQDLYIESIRDNPKIFVNVEYQRGLLLQKEKRYKDAVSHYSFGLYYLLNFFKAELNPTGHIIDYVTNDIQIIEMAQYKFVNKIKRCIKDGEVDINNLIIAIQYLTTKTALKIDPTTFLQDLLMLTRDCYFDINEDVNTMPIKEEFNYYPASFTNKRTEFRTMIRTAKKNKEPLEDILNSYYNLCVIQQILYGYYPTKNGVNGFYGNIIEIMLKKINQNDLKFSFSDNGYIDKSEFISQTDYKNFVKCFGVTEKSTDYKLMYDNVFNSAIKEYKDRKFAKDDDFGKAMFLSSIDEDMELVVKTRNNQF